MEKLAQTVLGEKHGGRWVSYLEPVTNPDEEHFLRSTINHHIPEAHGGNRGPVFPGPMAVSFNRKRLETAYQQKYWITEKSDGTRVMLLSVKKPNSNDYFTYLFDRNYQFYRTNEQIHFPQRSSIPGADPARWTEQMQNEVLLDGELLYNMYHKTWAFTVYDVVAYTDNGRVETLQREPMTRRIEVIKRNIVEAHWKYLKMKNLKPPKVFCLLAKHFYHKEEVGRVFQEIRAEGDKFIYKGYNETDGIIFTPEQYDFKPHASDFCFKWKWPHKLTVDFKVTPGKTRESYCLEFLYRGRTLAFHNDVQFRGEQPTDVREALRVLESERRAPILELMYKPNDGWVPQLHRTDKDTPNGYRTVSETLENIAEGLTKEELIHKLDPKARGEAYQFEREKQRQEKEKEMLSLDSFPTTHFALERRGPRYIYQVFNPNGNARFDYRDNYKEWRANLEGPLSEEVTKKLSTTSVVYVKCLFNVWTGTWWIVEEESIEVFEKESGPQQVLFCLEETIDKVTDVRERAKKRPREE